ncbi:MAG: hypothetical protein J7K36_10150, partial [Archaeoglobaceae archaeon]|nr:hypothetical protein [Archaeoglobaceae archaeon]
LLKVAEKVKNDELKFFVVDASRKIINVNGIMCTLENGVYFDVFKKSIIDGKPITLVLNMNLGNPNYIYLRKTEIKIPKEVLGKLFKKLKDNEVILDLISTPYGVEDVDFEEIGVIDFVKGCLKFESLYGDFLTLDEIKKMGKVPIVVNVKPIEIFKDECKNLWNKQQRLHPLSGKYDSFLTMTCQKVSDYFFERCEECKNKGNDCVFGWSGHHITNPDFRDLCLRKDIIAIKVEMPKEVNMKKVIKVVEQGRLVRIENHFILDNPFVKAICEMWKNKKNTLDEIKPIFEEIIRKVAIYKGYKGYVTLEDIEELASKNEDIKKSYELIKKWIENYGKIEKQ